MNTNNIDQHAQTAQEALRAFLTTLLGSDAPLHIQESASSDFDSVSVQSKSHIVLLAGTSKADRFALMLDPRWLPLLSESMLGEPVELGEPGADDLLRELASQGYGSVRTQLAATGVTLPEISFELHERGADLDGSAFSDDLVDISFSMQFNGDSLGGLAVLPSPQAAPAPAPRDAKTSADEQPASGTETPAAPSVPISSASFPDLGAEDIGGDGANRSFALLADVELEVTVELGRRKIPLADVLRLTTGSVIELEKLVGEPLEVYANGRLIAEGEAVVIDEQFGIRVTNLMADRQRAKAFV